MFKGVQAQGRKRQGGELVGLGLLGRVYCFSAALSRFAIARAGS